MNTKLSLLGIAAIALVITPALIPATQSFGQDEEQQQNADDDIAPAPPSIGADIPLTYFGPAPSTVQKELVGPLQLLRSGEIDQEAGVITLPLYRGQMGDGTPVWYILTDTSHAANAAALGLNHSPKL